MLWQGAVLPPSPSQAPLPALSHAQPALLHRRSLWLHPSGLRAATGLCGLGGAQEPRASRDAAASSYMRLLQLWCPLSRHAFTEAFYI